MITSTLKDPLRVSQTPAMVNYLISLASTMVDNPSNSPHLEEEKNVRGPSLRLNQILPSGCIFHQGRPNWWTIKFASCCKLKVSVIC